MSTLRDRVSAAAVAQIGEYGMHGLSHRKVDDRAGVPAGTTSNYYRTRAALVTGAIEHLEASDRTAWEDSAGGPTPRSPGELASALVGFTDGALTVRRAETVARISLFAEASTNLSLAANIGTTRERILEWVTQVLAEVGAADPPAAARILAHFLDGLILHKIASGDIPNALDQFEIEDLTTLVVQIIPGRGLEE